MFPQSSSSAIVLVYCYAAACSINLVLSLIAVASIPGWPHIFQLTMTEPKSTANATPSKKDVWMENYITFKAFYEENGHLTLPKERKDYLRLSQWLTYQRHTSKSLRKDQLKLLESINYATTPAHRKVDEDEWNGKYMRMKHLKEETGSIRVPRKEHDLASWVSRQKNLIRSNLLDPKRKLMLMKLGIGPSKIQSRRVVKNKKYDEMWQSQYQKLLEYHQNKGDCNVPRYWKQDTALGEWTHNQRKQFGKKMTGEVDMDPDRIQKLEKIGFQWKLRKAKYRINHIDNISPH